ncbi:hypothetical protein [Clostridioides difficile]|uniref:hypothetical protein n=1 Tax=Clostridioides difficile TaxID=1496 RepID=UPI00117EF655|nr:hypothetical protein [Clostridioides difficile]HDF2606902.1 hypothetical protein [Clostridioides difficile]
MLSLFWGFRLTMWYVKIYRNGIERELEAGFRLTMWYVKHLRSYLKLQVLKCFRLTMWYVKRITSSLTSLTKLEFYINYVVCKLSYFIIKVFLFICVLY